MILPTLVAVPLWISSVLKLGKIELFQAFKNAKASKSKFISASEFAGKGKVMDVLKMELVDDKFNSQESANKSKAIQFMVFDRSTNSERIWTVNSKRAVAAVQPLLITGKLPRTIRVRTEGIGMETRYFAEDSIVDSSTAPLPQDPSPKAVSAAVPKMQPISKKKKKKIRSTKKKEAITTHQKKKNQTKKKSLLPLLKHTTHKAAGHHKKNDKRTKKKKQQAQAIIPSSSLPPSPENDEAAAETLQPQ